MKTRNVYVTRLIICCIFILTGCIVAYAAGDSLNKDIIDMVTAEGSFTTLLKALQATGLVDTLKGPGPYTLFAPNDDAFKRLPKGMLDDLLKPESKAKLASILTYHVVPKKVTLQEAIKLKQLDTVNGQRPIISQDADIVAFDNAKILQHDIACSNGIIHIIDTPVIPR